MMDGELDMDTSPQDDWPGHLCRCRSRRPRPAADCAPWPRCATRTSWLPTPTYPLRSSNLSGVEVSRPSPALSRRPRCFGRGPRRGVGDPAGQRGTRSATTPRCARCWR
jgi:hypothetical protein